MYFKKLKLKVNNYIKSKLNDKNKKTAIISRIIIFILIFIVFFLILYGIFSLFNFSAIYVNSLMSIFDKNNIIVGFNDYSGFMLNGENIFVSKDCSGAFELAVFLALILATFEVSWRKRLYGILILIPLFFIVNFLRIYIIVYGIVHWPLGTVNILHTLLFKVGFFLFFVAYYYIWLYVFSKKELIKNETI